MRRTSGEEFGIAMTEDVPQEIGELHEWLLRRDFRYFNMNSTPTLRGVEALCRRWRFLGIVRRQIFRLSPIEFRWMFPAACLATEPTSPILLAQAYLLLWDRYRDPRFLAAFHECKGRVMDYRSPLPRHFAIRANRNLHLRQYQMTEAEPSPLATALAGELFLESWRRFDTDEDAALAAQAVAYLVREHPRDEEREGVYFYYEPKRPFRVYNASAAISGFLVKAGALLPDAKAWDLGRRGLEFVCSRQNLDGSWLYGESAGARYIDGFHSAFILQALYDSLEYLDAQAVERSFRAGIDYYRTRLFRRQVSNQMEPRHFVPELWPTNSSLLQRVDLRDAALAIILFSKCSLRGHDGLEHASAVLQWTNRHMKAGGAYCPEITWFWKNRIPYIEFQAWMLLALAWYQKALGGVLQNGDWAYFGKEKS
jgi:hypothetical protein